MGTALWTIFAVAAMLVIFSACTVIVVFGVRTIEHVVAKHCERRTS
jgi:hypothetical protein